MTLFNVVNNSEIRIFADDTCLHIKVDNVIETANLLNEDLLAIENWANQWLVQFSPTKTVAMTISTKRNKPEHPALVFYNQAICEHKSHKYLGLWLDNNLTWKSHINSIVKQSTNRMMILNFYKYKLSRKTLERIYFVFVRPVLEYASIVWAGASEQLLRRVDQVQIRAMRLSSGATNRSNIGLLYADLQWQSLRSRRDYFVVKMFFKIVNGMCPNYLKAILPLEVNDIRRSKLRNPNKLTIPKTRLNLFKSSFVPRGISMWNNLPQEYYSILTLTSFDCCLRKKMYNVVDKFQKQIYSFGRRSSNITRARLRMNCSLLNDHLCNNLHVISNPNCPCGYSCESVFHFFFQCPLYDAYRDVLIQNIQRLTLNISVKTFLHGDESKSVDTNYKIIKEVDRFLVATNRFNKSLSV